MYLFPHPGKHKLISFVVLYAVGHSKFLGTTVVMNLRWSQYIKVVSKKINKIYYAISRLKNALSQTYLHSIYYSRIYDHFTCNVILTGCLWHKKYSD